MWAQHRDQAFANETIHVPELRLHHAPLLEATQVVIQAFWRYNASSAPIVARFTNSVTLPTDYLSIHIRAGDKSTETSTFDFSEYMTITHRISVNKNAFIMTDDYTVIENLRIQYPNWHFYTLCTPSERGYFQKEFVHQDENDKFTHHLKLFSEIDIAAGGIKFIGTYSSNIGMYMGMRIGPEHCHCLDFDHWVIW